MRGTEEPSMSLRAKPETPPAEAAVREVEERFIDNWGEISALWGVNRTVGRIHALLFLSEEPLDMEQITRRLLISHGNCSTSLRDLLAWGVIRRVHRAGERRAFYEAEKDPWTWFTTCIRERRRREVAPVRDALHQVDAFARGVATGIKGPQAKDFARTIESIGTFTRFVDEFVDLIDAFLALGNGPMGKVFRMAARFMPKGGKGGE
jgi:DNA-binding transcriptional regulator GbsR (MarR family)